MKFIKYKNKKDFLECNLEILLKEEVKNEVMIGILLEHSEEKTSNWLLGRIEDDGNVKIIFLVDDDRKGLLFYLLEENMSNEIADFLADILIEENVELQEVLSSINNSKFFAETYRKKVKCATQEGNIAYIYKFENFHEKHVLNNGEKLIKVENLANKEILEKLVKQMYKDTYFLEDCPREKIESTIDIFLKKGLYVLENENNEIVCQSVTVRKQINCAAIGAVITLPEFRGKGYAKRCVFALCEKLLEEGYKFLALHVRSDNEPAISVYKKIGFKPIDETLRIKFLNNNE